MGQDNTWYDCNDAHVYPVSISTVLQSQAYVLIYEKIQDPENSEKRYLNTNTIVDQLHDSYQKDNENYCFLSIQSLYQLLYKTQSIDKVCLNADIACKHGNLAIETKCDSFLAIPITFWEEL